MMKFFLFFLFFTPLGFAQHSKLVLINPSQVSYYLQNGLSKTQNMQTGKSNEADLHLINDDLLTLQKGNYNEIIYRDNSALLSAEISILQNGNNNRTEIYGNNSISENMQLQIHGNNREVTIINHR